MREYFSLSREMGIGKNDFTNLVYDLGIIGAMAGALLYFAVTGPQNLSDLRSNDRGIEQILQSSSSESAPSS